MERGGMKLVVDTGVLMLILKGDPRVKDVVNSLVEGVKAVTAATNLVELYYKTEEKLGRQVALTWFNRLIRLKNLDVAYVDANLALKAGMLKAKYRGELSLADAVIAAVAEMEKSPLLTTDSRLKMVKEVDVKLYSVE
ncbi:PIN domain-containing protein [Candidatus Bathyarchaeota archaeon]|nr:MAG: PIN domain-containing protein [Candidatus Bathyarchaeota archaeon]